MHVKLIIKVLLKRIFPLSHRSALLLARKQIIWKNAKSANDVQAAAKQRNRERNYQDIKMKFEFYEFIHIRD
jgi:hypothetical protein